MDFWVFICSSKCLREDSFFFWWKHIKEVALKLNVVWDNKLRYRRRPVKPRWFWSLGLSTFRFKHVASRYANKDTTTNQLAVFYFMGLRRLNSKQKVLFQRWRLAPLYCPQMQQDKFSSEHDLLRQSILKELRIVWYRHDQDFICDKSLWSTRRSCLISAKVVSERGT